MTDSSRLFFSFFTIHVCVCVKKGKNGGEKQRILVQLRHLTCHRMIREPQTNILSRRIHPPDISFDLFDR